MSAAKILVICTSIILALFIGWMVVVLVWGGPCGNYATAGSFGDSFGFVNALFSGIALVAIAINLYQAQTQLSIQQDELRQNTAELAGQREQLEKQNIHLAKQAAQSQFFQMLDSWQGMLAQVRGQAGSTPITGRGVFQCVQRRLVQNLEDARPSSEGEERRAKVIDALQNAVSTTNTQIGHYFRLLYHIMRFVDVTAAIERDTKVDFARIVRAHLSNAEMAILFYNCIDPVGEKLHPLVERYDLLQNIKLDDVIDESDFDFYPKTKTRWLEAGRLPRFTD